MAVKTNLLWLLLPFCIYLFGLFRPRDHFYIFYPPLILLSALTFDRGLWRFGQLSGRRWILPAVSAVLIVLYVFSAWHQDLVFIRSDLEYIFTYPENRSALFPSDSDYPFKVRIGWGFPYRLGWQTISRLYREGQLTGDWYSTDENNSIYWYTLGAPRNPCYPKYYVLPERTYKEPPLEVPGDIIERYYSLRAVVNVNNQPRLRLYEFDPNGSDRQPITYNEPVDHDDALYYQQLFAGDPLNGPILNPTIPLNPAPHFKPHPNMLGELAQVYEDPNTIYFQDQVSLLGYDLDQTWAKSGGGLVVTLYWHADAPVFLPYKVYVHLGEEQVLAQADDQPACGQSPTYTWRTGDVIMDRHIIFLPDDIPPGEYPLEVGLYEIRSGLRMDLLDQMGNPAGNSLTLLKVSILVSE